MSEQGRHVASDGGGVEALTSISEKFKDHKHVIKAVCKAVTGLAIEGWRD